MKFGQSCRINLRQRIDNNLSLGERDEEAHNVSKDCCSSKIKGDPGYFIR